MADRCVPRVGYLMSRFPKLTETFIAAEILALESQGIEVEIYPLRRERTATVHPEVRPLVDRAHFCRLLSWEVLAANIYWLGRRPGAYSWAWAESLWAALGSARYFFGSLAVIPLAAAIARKLGDHRISHVHAHFASHPATAGLVIKRLTGIPFSFTAHGSDLHREQRMLAEKVRGCRFAVAISQYNREWIVRVCGDEARSKVHVIHCGVDPQRFRPTTSSSTFQSPLQIICVGSLHEVKGQEFLMRACGELAGEGTDFRLHLVGSGPDQERLTRLAADESILEQTTFHGPRTRDEVIELLRASDVLVAPSVLSREGRREGIPVVLMEAMASGLPVVASRISGIPELVEDGVNGILTPPRDATAIAAALRNLAGDTALCQRLAAAGRETIMAEFNLDTEATKLARLFGVSPEPHPGRDRPAAVGASA